MGYGYAKLIFLSGSVIGRLGVARSGLAHVIGAYCILLVRPAQQSLPGPSPLQHLWVQCTWDPFALLLPACRLAVDLSASFALALHYLAGGACRLL